MIDAQWKLTELCRGLEIPAATAATCTAAALYAIGRAIAEQAKSAPEALGDSQPVARKMAPVQGWPSGIPWSLHLEAYAAYCKKWSPQPAMIEGGCRGGFSTGELDMFIPGWRERASEITALRAEVARLTELALPQRAEPASVQAFTYDETGEPYTVERLAMWLDAKYRRHGELEDLEAARLLRAMNAALAAHPSTDQNHSG